MKETGYEKYSKWIATIDKACNEDSYIETDDKRRKHYKLDNGLHVYKYADETGNNIRVSNGELDESMEILGALVKKDEEQNIIYDNIHLEGLELKGTVIFRYRIYIISSRIR